MDRRRFAPSAEGLESRALMASLFTGATGSNTQRPQNVPVTYEAKLDRIKNLPYFLSLTVPGRTIPTAITQPIQADLTAIRGQLHGPSSLALQAFNSEIRDAVGHTSLDAQTANGLDRRFRQAMESAGISATQLNQLDNDVKQLVNYDTTQSQPVFTATNDVTTILQIALGVGRPIKQPAAPKLVGVDRQIPSNVHLVKEGVLQPYFTGTYAASTTSATNTVLLLDDAGHVLGSSTVGTNGVYRVRPSNFLADGTYDVRVQIMDAGGDFSLPSASLSVTVGPVRRARG